MIRLAECSACKPANGAGRVRNSSYGIQVYRIQAHRWYTGGEVEVDPKDR